MIKKEAAENVHLPNFLQGVIAGVQPDSCKLRMGRDVAAYLCPFENLADLKSGPQQKQ